MPYGLPGGTRSKLWSGNGLVYGCYKKYPETGKTTRYVVVVKRKVVILLKLTESQEPKYME